jgi:TetR/AcrR family tetracycline transcriptional repressor
MKDEDKVARNRERISKMRERTHQRLEQQRQRVDARFDRMQARLEQKYGPPSDMQQRIVEAALELLKEDGLANLTQRKLATRLNMQAPALYWHFKNKEVLVDYMAEAILLREFSDLKPRADDESWQDWLIDHMARLRKAMLAYPDGARVVAGAHLYPAVTLARSLECGLYSLHSAGVELAAARHIITTATTYTFGYVIEEQSAPTPEQMENFDVSVFLAQYPYMALSMKDVDHSRGSREKEYLTGLQLIVEGAATIT